MSRPARSPARERAAGRSPAGSRAAVGPALRVRGRHGRCSHGGRPAPVRNRGRQRRVEPVRRTVAPGARPVSARLAPGVGQAPRVRHVPRRVLGRGCRCRALRAPEPGAVGRRSDHGDRPALRPRPARLDRSRRAPADDPRRARPAVGDLPPGARRARLLAHRDDHRRAGAGTPAKSDLPVEQPQQPAVLVLPRPRRRNARPDQVVAGAAGPLRRGPQGETVGAVYTANLGYVRELRPPTATPAT